MRASHPYLTGKLPQSYDDWLKFEGVNTDILIGKNSQEIEIATFGAQPDSETITYFLGGVVRDTVRRGKLPIINKLFGLIASGLHHEGEGSLFFNWPGQGRSSGDVMKTSIRTRSEQLLEIIERTRDGRKVNLVGASMGAYHATLAAEQLNETASNLVLVSPAAYPETSHELTYEKGFGEHLKNPWNPTESPSIQILGNGLQCGVFLSYCEFDAPQIPTEIQNAYRTVVTGRDGARTHVSYGVEHNFRNPKPSEHNGNIVNNNAVRELGFHVVEYLHAA